jgi:ElaB/YqjD/DUF883 family membrane-anchored ribosome-binding protein
VSRHAGPVPDRSTDRRHAMRRREETMSLTDQQKKFYENTLAVTRQEMEELDRAIEEELAKVKDRLAELQNAKKASRQMYDAACMRLGIANDLEAEEGRAEV